MFVRVALALLYVIYIIMGSNKKGGEVLASGGFGCVFSPALKCDGTNKRTKNTISKLMTEKHAMQEYNEILSIKSKLHDIPEYARYFMVDGASVCKPNKLTRKDLSNFHKKCTALPKHNITAININRSLDELLSLNMPYGGIPVDDFIYQVESFGELIELNDSLKRLLLHGIIPMNERNVYHSDVKDSNVLVNYHSDENELDSKLIDWGLSVAPRVGPSPSSTRPRSCARGCSTSRSTSVARVESRRSR